MGVIAQEVEAVFPELIEPNEGSARSIRGLVPPLLLAVSGLDAACGRWKRNDERTWSRWVRQTGSAAAAR